MRWDFPSAWHLVLRYQTLLKGRIFAPGGVDNLVDAKTLSYKMDKNSEELCIPFPPNHIVLV